MVLHDVPVELAMPIHNSCESGLEVAEEHPSYPTARALRIVADWLSRPESRTLTLPNVCRILRAMADDQDPPEEDL